MRKIFIVVIILSVFSSCYTEVDLSDMVDDTGPVVSAFIANDSLIKVHLFKAIGANEISQKVYITDASVKLFEDGIEVEDLVLKSNSFEKNGLYYTTYYYTSVSAVARAWKTYRLEIRTSEGELVTCETTIPEPVEILSLDTTFFTTIDTLENTFYEEEYFRIRFKDPPDRNFYRITMKTKNGYYKNIITVRVWEREEIHFHEIDPVFSYFGENEENNFSGSVRNSFLIFTDKTINDKEYEIKLHRKLTGDMNESYPTMAFTQYTIELHSLTEEGYRYLRSVDLQNQSGEGLNEPVIVYTNIENGVGIFTGYSASQKVITIGEYPEEGVEYK